MSRRLLRLTSEGNVPSVTGLLGLRVTTVYHLVKTGLLTRPIKLTQRSSAWPEDEIAAIVDARIAEKGDAEIRRLVASLMKARKRSSPQQAAA